MIKSNSKLKISPSLQKGAFKKADVKEKYEAVVDEEDEDDYEIVNEPIKKSGKIQQHSYLDNALSYLDEQLRYLESTISSFEENSLNLKRKCGLPLPEEMDCEDIEKASKPDLNLDLLLSKLSFLNNRLERVRVEMKEII